MTSPIRLAFVTDIHHGPDQLTKNGSVALGLLDEFARFAPASRADAVIDLDDRISDEPRDADLRTAAE